VAAGEKSEPRLSELAIKPKEAAWIMDAISLLSNVQESLSSRNKSEPPELKKAKELLIIAFKEIQKEGG